MALPLRLKTEKPITLTSQEFRVMEVIKELSKESPAVSQGDIADRIPETTLAAIRSILYKLLLKGAVRRNGEHTTKIRYLVSDDCAKRGFAMSEYPSQRKREGRNGAKAEKTKNLPKRSNRKRGVIPPHLSAEEIAEQRELDRRDYILRLSEQIAEKEEFLRTREEKEKVLSARQKDVVARHKKTLAEAEGNTLEAAEFREVFFQCNGRIFNIRSPKDVPECLRRLIEDLERQIDEAEAKLQSEMLKAGEELASLYRKKEYANQI